MNSATASVRVSIVLLFLMKWKRDHDQTGRSNKDLMKLIGFEIRTRNSKGERLPRTCDTAAGKTGSVSARGRRARDERPGRFKARNGEAGPAGASGTDGEFAVKVDTRSG